ncbi:MAG: hypothetical protein GY898_12025 [Proteobacteria bacterium]|nr:hypothetical protein [Pseudomonadota bacterium]
MTRPTLENLHAQLVAVDHECLFAVVLYAYERVSKGADRSILHRAVLSLDYRADPDEVNRLRQLQRKCRELGRGDDVVAELEAMVDHEYGKARTAFDLARMSLDELRDHAVRWTVVSKRGPTIRVSPELMGLLERLYPDDSTDEGYPAFVEGTEAPSDATGKLAFPEDPSGVAHVYRPPEDVIAAYMKLSFVDRPSLDAAIDAVVGDGPDAEETATWLESDFEALTARYELAAARGSGIHYRYS